jgi:hypothetical protein
MLLWLIGCEAPEHRFVEPFDGSSAVRVDDPLQVVLEGADYPEGEPVPDDAISVVDLDRGGDVPGTLVYADDRVVFAPDEPWRDGGAYGWVVATPAPRARAPLLDVPSGLEGEATFRVGGGITLLDAAIEDGELCLLFSQSIRYVAALTVDGVELGAVDSTPRPVSLPSDLASTDHSGRCVAVDAKVGDLVRYTAPDGVPSAVRVGSESLAARWKARHRWMEP